MFSYHLCNDGPIFPQLSMTYTWLQKHPIYYVPITDLSTADTHGGTQTIQVDVFPLTRQGKGQNVTFLFVYLFLTQNLFRKKVSLYCFFTCCNTAPSLANRNCRSRSYQRYFSLSVNSQTPAVSVARFIWNLNIN